MITFDCVLFAISVFILVAVLAFSHLITLNSILCLHAFDSLNTPTYFLVFFAVSFYLLHGL